MDIPPREPFAAAARHAIEDHTEWDAAHAFITFRWDGAKLSAGTYACIMPDIEPDDYPQLMAGLALEELQKDPGDPAYAYLLQTEGYGVKPPGPDATDKERLQYRADRRQRRFHQRPDAVEIATAILADVHGRLWQASHTRSDPGVIAEKFYEPGDYPGGQLTIGLLAVARATGFIAYGLKGPEGYEDKIMEILRESAGE